MMVIGDFNAVLGAHERISRVSHGCVLHATVAPIIILDSF